MIKYETEVAGGREGFRWFSPLWWGKHGGIHIAWISSVLASDRKGAEARNTHRYHFKVIPFYTSASQTLHPQDPPSLAPKQPVAGEQVFRHMTWGKGNSHKDHSRDQMVTDQFNEFNDAPPVATWFLDLESFLQVFCCLGLHWNEA